MDGYSRKMPSIARYDSWNPVEEMASGLNTSWMSRAVHQTLSGVLLLPGQFRAISASNMNRKALTIEGDALTHEYTPSI